jgi:hypothetical protein
MRKPTANEQKYPACDRTLPPIWREAVSVDRRHEGSRHANNLHPIEYAGKRTVSGFGHARRSPQPLRQWAEGSHLMVASTNEKTEITDKERRDIRSSAVRYRGSLDAERSKARAHQRRVDKLKFEAEDVVKGERESRGVGLLLRLVKEDIQQKW